MMREVTDFVTIFWTEISEVKVGFRKFVTFLFMFFAMD